MEDKKIERSVSPKNQSLKLFITPYTAITQLRIPTDLIQNKTLIQNIKKIIGGEINIEPYMPEPNYHKNFKTRQESLFKACQYIITTLVLLDKQEEMFKTLQIIKKNHPVSNVDCLLNYQKTLVNYKEKLIDLCTVYLKNKTRKKIIEIINKAEQYVILQEGRPNLVTLVPCCYGSFQGYSLQWEKQISGFNTQMMKDFEHIKTNQSLPQWFLHLEGESQKFLNQALQTSPHIKNQVRFLSSRHRELPGIPNYAKSMALLLDTSGNLIQHFDPIFRSGHLASRDIQEWPEEIQEQYCQDNYNMILRGASNKKIVYIGTYISPSIVPLSKSNLPIISTVSNIIDNVIPQVVSLPDKKLHERLEKIINKTKTQHTVYFKNHPQNMARISDYTDKDDPNCKKIIDDAKKQCGQNPQIKPLIEACESALNSGFGTSYFRDYNGRELYLAASFCLLILAMGGHAHITCVSGKDRTALVLIQILAMRIYHRAFGEWPLYSDTGEKRAELAEIYAVHYCSGHGQSFAKHNAPGSNGIQNAETYLPGDYVKAIKKIRGEHSLEDDNVLARNNEFSKIKISGSEDYYPACLYAAKKLSLEQCEKLINQLSILTCEKPLPQQGMFASFTSYVISNTPKGVRQLSEILSKSNENNKSRQLPFKILAQIYMTILNRPDNSDQRKEVIKTLYNLIKTLCLADNPNQLFPSVYQELCHIKTLTSLQEQEPVSNIVPN